MIKQHIQSLYSKRREIIESWYDNQFNEELIRMFGIQGLESRDRSWVRPSYLEPLLNLLLEYLRTGEERYLVVYRDERLRYSPHTASPKKRSEFFRLILPTDENSLLDRVNPTSRSIFRSTLSFIHAPLMEFPEEGKGKDPVYLLCLGDCLMGEIRVFLSHRALQTDIPLDVRILYFSASMNRALSIDEVIDYTGQNKVDMVAMSFMSFRGIPAYANLLLDADNLSQYEMEKRVASLMSIVHEFIDGLRRHLTIPFLIHDACGLPLTGIRRHVPFIPPMSRGRTKALALVNQGLRELASGSLKCAIISETILTEKKGHRLLSKPLIPKRIVGKGYFHTSVFGSFMAENYLPILKSYHTLRSTKLILVDFDNTLWNGVMADGPVEHFVEKQKLLLKLKEAGILLAAISKNSPENIRWNEMEIQPEHFVSLKINWNLKVQSVREIATELNLGMNSFVLLDDNPAEIELIHQSCPSVVCLDSRKEETWMFLEQLFLFPNTQGTEESRSRTEMYRAQAARQKCITGELDYPEMMRSLGLRISFGKAKPRDLDRLTELINRTNQFNTTTIRFTKNDLCRRDGGQIRETRSCNCFNHKKE